MTKDSIQIADAAAKRMKDFLANQEEGLGLRLSAVRTHCMGGRGFGYELSPERTPSPEDVLVEANGVKLYVDPATQSLVKGIEIDYVEDWRGAGFTFDNPNAVRKCPCGHHDLLN